jgi:hypothetical protein
MDRNVPASKQSVRDVLAGRRKLKSEVEYRVADKDSEKRCSECCYYVNPGQPQADCAKVVGQVESFGTCNLWEQNPTPPEDRGNSGESSSVSVVINMRPGT